MPQFVVYENRAGSRDRIPYLLDIQSDLLDVLATRVVVPLYRKEAFAGKGMTRLMPLFEVAGEQVVMVTPEVSGVSRKHLGEAVTNLAAQRPEIVAALDMLIAGV
jgi:toxin CcdB